MNTFIKYSWIPLFFLLFIACNSGEKEPVEKDPPPAPHYTSGEVTQGQLGATVSLPAVLQPFEIVDIFPRVSGFIRDIPVDRGSRVKKGQLLIRLEAPEIEQQYLAAKARYLQSYALFLASRDNYSRLLVANKLPGTVSPHDLELAKARLMADSATVQAETANYKALEATKDYLVVTAPFSGVITERNVHPGALVGPNPKPGDKPMLVLQQESTLRLVIDVPEVYSNQLSGRSAIQFRVSTLPGKIFRGTLSRSAGSLNQKYRSEAVEMDVANEEGLLKPGMYAEVLLPVSRNSASLIVPRSAIITSTERKYVIKVQDNKAHWVDITEGNSRNDSTEVFGDLRLHDQVILHAGDEIKEGTAIPR